MMADVMTCTTDDVQRRDFGLLPECAQSHDQHVDGKYLCGCPVERDFGLLPDEERHLAAECARLGSWPRVVVIKRTGTQYVIPNRHKARKLLRLLGIESL